MPRDALNSASYAVPVTSFSQAVRTGPPGAMVFVSGLTARRADGTVAAIGDPAAQTREILSSLSQILAEAGGSLDDVVRIVTYLVDMQNHAVVHAVRSEFFGDDPPASTTVEISRLYDTDQLLEIEATAVLPT